ncbi:hypothetical protein HPB48_011225 [Haemaphysalis longicornis]|uniref:Monocarboxylate transporter n=1 Tax=Haemaphysalis longicornis TaxID=44386 RepID=A0A9J6GAC0_HAELO|nr:hypothetical protein HPB48_011225 [Haemaphysalis longicornis]
MPATLERQRSDMKNRVDSRWDLLVVMMMAGVFCTATYRSSGWFYVAYMEEFKVDRQGASWPGSVYKTAFRCAGISLATHELTVWPAWEHNVIIVGVRNIERIRQLLAVREPTIDGVRCEVQTHLKPAEDTCRGVINVDPAVTEQDISGGSHKGLGCGTVLVTHLVLIMKYFNKYRGVAAGVRMTSNPMSAIIFPAVLSALKDAYGFRGALLVFAAITMHATALSIMLKEPPWLTPSTTIAAGRTSNKGAAPGEIHDETGCDASLLQKAEYRNGQPRKVKQYSKDYDRDSLQQDEGMPLRKCPSHGTENDVTTKSNTTRPSKCAEMRYSSRSSFTDCECAVQEGRPKFLRLDSLALADEHLIFEGGSNNVGTPDRSSAVSDHRRSTENTDTNADAVPGNREAMPHAPGIQYVTPSSGSKPSPLLLRLSKLCSSANVPSPGFVVAVLLSMLMDYVNIVHIFTIVDYAIDKGVPAAHAAMTITYIAAPEILGRTLLPLAADVGLVSRPILSCGAMTILGLLFSITPETSGVAHVIVRALSSVTIACTMTSKHVLIADYLGAEAISLVSGTSGLLLVPLLFCNPLIMGEYLDSSLVNSLRGVECVDMYLSPKIAVVLATIYEALNLEAIFTST